MGTESRIAAQQHDRNVSKIKATAQIPPRRRARTGKILLSITTVAALLAIAVGAVFEKTRISLEQSALAAATDSAALAIGADDRAVLDQLPESEKASRIAELERYAKQVLLQNYALGDGSPENLKIKVAITDHAISVTTSRDIFTAFLGVGGKSQTTIEANSEVAIDHKNNEIE